MNTNTNNTNIPNNLIEYIIEYIHESKKIKHVLRLLYLISCQPESTPWITHEDLRAEFMESRPLSNQLGGSTLLSLIKKQFLSSHVIDIANTPTRIYALNLKSTSEILSKYQKLSLSDEDYFIERLTDIDDSIHPGNREVLKKLHREIMKESPVTNVFALYEKMIGPLSPMIADKLKEASTIYSHRWITDAFNESVRNNKKNWNYISAILKQKAYPENIQNGKTNGKSIGNIKKNAPKRFLGN